MVTAPLWEPPRDARSRSRMGRFLAQMEEHYGVSLATHEAAWAWSIDHLDEFWGQVVDQFGIRFLNAPTAVLASRELPGARWFPGATLNYAEAVLAAPGVSDEDPIVW